MRFLGMHPAVQAIVQKASDRRVAWAAFATALLLATVVLAVHKHHWTPAYTDYGQVGERYTFPLNGKIAEEDGVSYYWARCGHNHYCGPIAFRGDPPLGLDHVVLKVPSRDPEARQIALPEPVEAECSWRGDCPDFQTRTVNVTTAWGPYEQAPVRVEQAVVGFALAAAGATAANLRRGPYAGARAFLATTAGVLLAAGLPVDGTFLWVLGFLGFIPTLLLAGLLSALSRRWPAAGRLSVALLWAAAGWLGQSLLFLAWFPGPPTA